VPISKELLLVALFVGTDQQTRYHQKGYPEHLVNGYSDFPLESTLWQRELFPLALPLFSLDAMTSLALSFCLLHQFLLDFLSRAFPAFLPDVILSV